MYKFNYFRFDDFYFFIVVYFEFVKCVFVNKEYGYDSVDVGIDGLLVVGGEVFEVECGK